MTAPHERRTFSNAAWCLALVGAWAVCVVVSLFVCGNGYLHPETQSFLPHFLSGRPFLVLIYDNRVTDWNNYCARELSFAFDWLDAQFVAASARRGMPHFFSASHYLLLLAGGLALWRIATRHLSLPRIVSLPLVLLLWTCPTAMFYSSCYRTAKVALLCATLLAILAWFSARQPAASAWRAVLFGVAAALLPMCDKLGLLFLFGLIPFLAHQAITRRTDANRRVLLAGCAALLFAWSYQRWIGPEIIRHLLGYEVNVDHLALSFGMLADPRVLATVLGGAPLFTLDSFRLLCGHLPAGLAILAGLWICVELSRAGSTARPRWLGGRGLFVGLVLFITATFAALLLVFPQMFSNEHRRFYYPLPSAAFWLVAVAAALSVHLRRAPQHARWLALGLAVLVFGNFFDLQADRFIFRHGKYEPYVANATRVRVALLGRDPTTAHIDPATAAKLLEQAPYFRDAVPPSLEQDRIFLVLRAQGRISP